MDTFCKGRGIFRYVIFGRPLILCETCNGSMMPEIHSSGVILFKLYRKKVDTYRMFEVEQWCFSEVLAKTKYLLILLGKNIEFFRIFWIELRYVSNVFGTNNTFFAVLIYNYNLFRTVYTKFNTFRIRPISDVFL